MNKVGVITIAVVVGVVAGGLGAVAYYWHQATQLPEWYNSTEMLPAVETEAASTILENKLISGEDVRYTEDSRVEIALDETEFNQVVVGAIADNPYSAELLQAARGVHTSINGDRVESGVVVNLSELPTERLAAQEQAVVERAIEMVPALTHQDVYIGIEGQPRIENGQFVFDENTKVKLGNLTMTLPQFADRLGVSQAQLEKLVNLNVPLGNVTLDGIEFIGDRAVVRGSVQE